MTALQRHLQRHEEIHVRPARGSGFALLMIDVDAHEGQQDALEAVQWIQSTYFPESYLEPSKRGYHLYLVVRVGFCKRDRFNQLMNLAEIKLKRLVADSFESTVELCGRFTEWSGRTVIGRSKPFQAPRCPNGQLDLERLISLPIYLPVVFKPLCDHAEALEELDHTQTSRTVDTSGPVKCRQKIKLVPKDTDDAFDRMVKACFHFTQVHRRLPEIDELVSHYEQLYDRVGDHDTRRRAVDAIKQRAKKFDPSKVGTAGFLDMKPKLLGAIRSRHHTQTSSTVDEEEDLAIALYAYTVTSFTKNENPRRQWTIGYDAIMGMFQILNDEGVTTRTCKWRNKVLSLRTALLNAGLIEAMDVRFVPSKNGTGICQKYTIGPSHWMYPNFQRFAETVICVKVTTEKETIPTRTYNESENAIVDESWRALI
jgi:hypothetical protein